MALCIRPDVSPSFSTMAAKTMLNQQNPGVGIAYGRSYSYLGMCLGVSNTVINLSHDKKFVAVNYDKLAAFVTKSISTYNKDHMDEWLQQESTCLISGEINRTIDIVCTHLREGGVGHAKRDIFGKLQSHLKTELNINGSQSSIKQTLRSSPYLMKKIDDLCDKAIPLQHKNVITSYIINSLTDRIYQKQFSGTDLPKVREHVAEEIISRINARNHLSPPFKI